MPTGKSKRSRPTMPAVRDESLESFEARVAAVGEWRARLENVVALASMSEAGRIQREADECADTVIMSEAEIDSLRARCLHD